MVGNAFYGRADAAVINPFAILGELPSFFAEPQRFWDFYRRLVSGGDAETLAEALHRAFDGTGEDVFVAVLNELTIGGADYTPLDHFGLGKASVEDNARIDALGQIVLLEDQERSKWNRELIKSMFFNKEVGLINFNFALL